MDQQGLLALMYDFYNSHMLKGQNDDIDYYIKQIKKYGAKDILVIGAGTGRVAIPLANYAKVTALDFDDERLRRLKRKSANIKTIGINFLQYQEVKKYDLIIIPYSTLQFDNNKENLNNFFKKLKEIMDQKSIVIFDVSESFKEKEEKNKEFLFKDYCSEIKDEVLVYYTAKKRQDYIEFYVEYRLDKQKKIVVEHEKYYYYNKKLIFDILEKNNFEILKIDDGYGKEGFKHKHLYHCRRKTNE